MFLLIIKRFILGEYESNCYVVSYNGEAIVIDPGYENNQVIPYLEQEKLILKYIFLTHGHFDHIGGVNQLKKHYAKAKVLVNEHDLIWIGETDYNITKQKVLADEVVTFEKSIFLDDLEFKIIFTPGHSAGGMSLLVNDSLFVGDTLFKLGIGRYDFPFGNYKILEQSIRKLYRLPDDTIVYPGHGDSTTIGFEKKYNYFIKESSSLR